MDEEDCSPLTSACVKALTDKIEEKRRFAASEIEKMTVEFAISNNLTMINRLIVVNRRFCLASFPNTRKGGLLGLAAIMVGFNNGSDCETPHEMVEEVVSPILTCFLDSDSQVRYYACESLFNIIKVARANILPLFGSIFDNLIKIVADPLIGVRSGAELLDRALKDIIVEQPAADVMNFCPKFEDYIYVKNPFSRLFIIGWIRLIDSKINMIGQLSSLLEGLFNCFYESTDEIRASTLGLLAEFLNKLVASPTDKLNIPSLVSTLTKHAKNEAEDIAQYTAIAWLRQLIKLMDDQELINFTPNILEATLPCLALHTRSTNSIRDDMTTSNMAKFMIQSPSRGNICDISSHVHTIMLDHITRILNDRKNSQSNLESMSVSDLEPILEILIEELQQDHPVIRLTVLEWLKKLIPNINLTAGLHEKLFQNIMETLSDKSDAVVRSALRVIADTTSQNMQFIQALYSTFRDKEIIFKDRATFIITNLCSMMKPDVIYKSFAEILKDEKDDVEFAYNLVQKLSQILLTTQALHGLRARLTNEHDQEMSQLFNSLYQAWHHSSIAVLTLCLLTQNYKQASEAVTRLSEGEITVETLLQIDWLVQLIESPILAPLRMKLLDANNNQYLLQSLFGLLMILPQSKAYERLASRLDQAQKFMSMQPQAAPKSTTGPVGTKSSILASKDKK